MLDPNRKYTFVIDKETNKCACVLIQALLGGDREPCFVFTDWEVNMSPNFIKVTGTGKQIEEFAGFPEARNG